MTTTDTERALLAAICAHPKEDDPCLRYADYLQEQGDDDRAEFIRVQCEIAVINEGIQSDEDCGQPGCAECDERRPLLARESALLAQYRERWLRVECPKCGGKGEKTLLPSGGDPIGTWIRSTLVAAGAGGAIRCHDCDGTGDSGGLALVKGNGDPRREVVFRRGFPDEVTGCRLADCFEQRGVYDPASDTERNVRWAPSGWMLRVLAHHPTVTRVPLADRVPDSHSGYVGGLLHGYPSFDWNPANAWRSVEAAPDALPQFLIDKLIELYPENVVYPESGVAVVEFVTAAAATDALAVAVVAVGRAALARGAA